MQNPTWLKTMKLSLITLLLLVTQTGLFAQQTGNLHVEINSIRTDDGKVAIAVHNGPEGFPGGAENIVASKSVDIENGKAIAEFNDLPLGEYAISVIHDENNNGELDTNWIGIPKEGVGASNNAKGRMGPPKYDDAKFDFKEAGQKIEFDMGYY